MHVGVINPLWREKRSRHFQRMRNPQIYVSGKRPVCMCVPTITFGIYLAQSQYLYTFHHRPWVKNGFAMSMNWNLLNQLYICIYILYVLLNIKLFSSRECLMCGAIWRHPSVTTLAEAMACCLMAPSHYPNQCWLRIREHLWHSFESNFTASIQLQNLFWNCSFKITAT